VQTVKGPQASQAQCPISGDVPTSAHGRRGLVPDHRAEHPGPNWSPEQARLNDSMFKLQGGTRLVLGSSRILAEESLELRAVMSDLIVATASGLVKGRWVDGIERYLGIPYAEAPVGDRRFQAPAPHRSWDGVRD